MSTVQCATHGVTQQTLVCQHIVDGLHNRKRVGFFWTTDDPENPCPDAWCEACEKRVRRTGGDWVGAALRHLQPKVMCSHCYEIAKTFHGGGNPWA